MAELGILHNDLSAKQGTRSIRASSNSARNGFTEESIPIKSVLLEFSSVIQENLKRDCPNVAISFKENCDYVECILCGCTQEVGNAKSKILSIENDLTEKKLQIATNTCSALKRFSIENIVSNLLKNDYQFCVAKQVHNQIFLFGFDRNLIDKAAKYVSGNISHRDFLLCGSQREKKEALVDHFQQVYQDRIVAYIDEACRLNLLGQKKTVDEACCEYNDINEGRKSISPTNMLPQEKSKVTERFGPLEPVYYRFFNKFVQLEKVVNRDKVKVINVESECSFFIQGEKENVSRAVKYLNETASSIRTREIKIPSSGPTSIVRLSEDKNDVEKCLEKFDVVLEKKITYKYGRSHLINMLQENVSCFWFSSGGKQLVVQFSALKDLYVDQKFVMKKRDPSKGGNFKVTRDGLVEIAVPDKVSREQTDDNTIGEIINATLGKVASSRVKVVAFLISPIANWDFNSIMKCMVNSFVEWLMRPGKAEGLSVTLCLENQVDFAKTDEYFGARLWTKIKEFQEIKIMYGYLDTFDADVIVNTVSPDLDLRNGKVSSALLKAAGQGLQEECTKRFPDGIKPDIIAVTDGYNLKCKAVFHITLPKERVSKCSIKDIRNAMRLCLKTASDYKYETIAFPAIGTGSLKHPIKEVASEMVMAMERLTKEYKKAVPIKEVLIVIHPKDTTLFETFQRMVKKLVVTTKEVNIIFEITGMEKNVEKCHSWLLSEGRLTPETEPGNFTGKQGSVLATSGSAPSITHHSPGTSHSPTDRLPDSGGCSTSAKQDSAHYTTSRWPGVAKSTIEHKPNIENDSKLIKQQISVNTDEDVKDHTVKNTARDRPKTFNMQNVNVPACLNISYEYDKKTLVCKFDKVGIEVQIYIGDIINLQKIQAIVCSENRAGNAKGIVAKLLLKKGGEEYLQDKATKFSNIPAFGDIVTTTGGSNSYMWIIHAIMPRREPQAICAMYRKIFEEVAKRRFTSVSLTLLGTGVGDVDPRTCTEMLLNELIQFCQTRKWDKLTIHVVINDKQVADIIKDVFTKTIDEMNASHKPEQIDEDESVISKLKSEASGGEVHESHDQFPHKEEQQLDEDKSVINKLKSEATGGEIHGSNDQVEAVEDCVICMDKVVDEKKLPCGHVFCAECIEGYFRVRMVCPTCGKVCGIVTGDQPDGRMEIVKQSASVAGYEKYKSIAICYTFDSGIQGAEHPHPGMTYNGIRRTAYLPDNQQGRQICCMLTVAFERRLVFTIGTSRTTGKESVITWNDVHHKTDMKPNTQFGYPDDTYLQRVGEELGVKGVTLQDVDQQLLKELEDDQFRKVITKMEK